jgi:hypothetical protein
MRFLVAGFDGHLATARVAVQASGQRRRADLLVVPPD